MTNKPFSFYSQWFDQYTQSFNDPDHLYQKNIRLKIEHTYRVCEAMRDIIASLHLTEDERHIAELTALFHDVGRFEQYHQYKTFNDHLSVDHAQLSNQILDQQHVLKHLSGATQTIIQNAIFNHNKRFIAKELTDPFQILFAKLIRDADKLDILYINLCHYKNYDDDLRQTIELNLPDGDDISEAVYQSIIDENMVAYRLLENKFDLRAVQISWVFDLNFDKTLELINQRGYINEIFETLPQTPRVKKLREHIGQYLAQSSLICH